MNTLLSQFCVMAFNYKLYVITNKNVNLLLFPFQLTTFFDRVGSDEENGVYKSIQDDVLAKVNQNIEWVSENAESITSWLQDVNKRMI